MTMNAYERAFTPMKDYTHTWVDRTGHGRSVPMRVLSLGWPRTATMSTSAALYQLGLHDTYHMNSVIANPADAKMWERAIAAKYEGQGVFTKADWDDLLGHCQAVTDWPASAFSEELIAAYPDAKVILHVRPTAKWWKSCQDTVLQPHFLLEPPLFVRFLFWASPSLGYVAKMARRLSRSIMNQPLLNATGPSTGYDSMPEKFEAHNARIQALVPPENLLLWGPADGWKPLCDFLDLPIPAGPVPYVNESAQFNENQRALMMKVLLGLVTKVVIGTSVVGVGIASYMGYIPTPRSLKLFD